MLAEEEPHIVAHSQGVEQRTVLEDHAYLAHNNVSQPLMRALHWSRQTTIACQSLLPHQPRLFERSKSDEPADLLIPLMGLHWSRALHAAEVRHSHQDEALQKPCSEGVLPAAACPAQGHLLAHPPSSGPLFAHHPAASTSGYRSTAHPASSPRRCCCMCLAKQGVVTG